LGELAVVELVQKIWEILQLDNVLVKQLIMTVPLSLKLVPLNNFQILFQQ
jgi:hypothetical protein